MKRRKFVSFAAVLSTLAIAGPLRAELLFYEGFDYAADSVIAGQNPPGEATWLSIGTSMNTAADSLTFGSLATSGGAAISSDPENAETRRISIATGLPEPTAETTGVIWVSYLTRQTNGKVDWQGATFTLGNVSGGTIQNKMIRVGTIVAGSGNPLNAGTGGSYGFFNSGITQQFNTGVTSSDPLFMVIKYDYDNTTITFYVNPAPGTPEGSLTPLGTLTVEANNLLKTQHMRLTAIELEAANVYSGDVLFDEVRIGETWADVSPVAGIAGTFADWLAANPPAAGFITDSDNDGVPNGVENLLGTDPNAFSQGLTQISATPTSSTFVHSLSETPASDVTLSYQWSSDLVEWKGHDESNTAGTKATITASAPVAGEVTVTTAITEGPSSKIFTRLVATQNP